VSVIKVEERGTNQFDSQWLDFVFSVETAEGAGANMFISVPTTAERSFLFGSKKSLREYSTLEKFLAAFGVQLEYSSAISTIADLFEKPSDTFIGKTLSIRFGFRGNHIKYCGKANDLSTYMIVDKNDSPIDATVFNSFDTAKEHAKQNNIKLQDFIKPVEFIAATTSAISTSKAVDDLPF
jgi:hypothetical protein